jgi:plastocyanin
MLILAVAAAGAAAATEHEEETVADNIVVAGPGAFQAGYATPVALAGPGVGLTFHNLDLPRHDVVAHHAYGPDDNPWCEAYPAGACPAFWSPLVGLGESAEVLGLDQLETGVYEFYCTAHPWMHGTLVVADDGGAAASLDPTPSHATGLEVRR